MPQKISRPCAASACLLAWDRFLTFQVPRKPPIQVPIASSRWQSLPMSGSSSCCTCRQFFELCRILRSQYAHPCRFHLQLLLTERERNQHLSDCETSDLIKGFAFWNAQLLNRLLDRKLKSKEETTVDCDNVCPAVDRHKWNCETCGGRLLLSFYEVFYGAMHVLHDLVLLLLRHWRPNGLSDGIKIDELSKLFCRGQFSWTKDISGNCLLVISKH